jgi:hypothetical protein
MTEQGKQRNVSWKMKTDRFSQGGKIILSQTTMESCSALFVCKFSLCPKSLTWKDIAHIYTRIRSRNTRALPELHCWKIIKKCKQQPGIFTRVAKTNISSLTASYEVALEFAMCKKPCSDGLTVKKMCIWTGKSLWWHKSSSSVICHTTGPKPLPKRFLHLMRSRASSFKWEYPLLSPRSSSKFLRLLPHFYLPLYLSFNNFF